MRKVRVGVIGAGVWAIGNHIPILKARDDVELVGVNRMGEQQLQAVKEKFGFQYASLDYREILARELDAVIVSSPAKFHHEQTKAALESGAHVLTEKPFTVSAADAWDLVATAKAKDRHLLVSFGYNYKPMVREAKRLMEDGGIGSIEYMTVRMASGIRELLRTGQYPSHVAVPGFPSEYATWAKPDTSGGGYAPGQLSHAMGVALWLSGLRVAEAFAWMSNGGTEVDMYDAIALKYEGGAIGTLSGGASPSDWGRDQLDVRIYGSEGQLIIDVERAFVSRFHGKGKEVRLPLDGSEGAYECTGPPNTLIDLALGKTVENCAPGELGARTVEPVEAAEKSARTGRAERTRERAEGVTPAR